MTDFLKVSITTDSIKISSITFCTLVTVYCTFKIAKDAFRIDGKKSQLKRTCEKQAYSATYQAVSLKSSAK